MKNSIPILILILGSTLILGFSPWELDPELRSLIKTNKLNVRSTSPGFSDSKVELGRMLFFDKILSGNKDLSCATCHHPAFASSDGLPLAIGVGGNGLGDRRKMGDGRERIPRNSPDIFNRGSSEWHTMFWDNRVSGSVIKGYDSPADEKLLDGLESILAVQAMFPVTSRDEMRGEIGDRDVNGEINELALISNASPHVIWHRLMLRILKIPKYRQLFKAAYPDVKEKDLGFQHAANAIAAFEIEAFTFNDSPWDQYIDGNLKAISDEAKHGALLFYGKANCSSCHSGTLMTDQLTHNIGVPQLGPGKGSAEPLDVGRYLETGEQKDLFAFRTPSLKNTAITGPWMHNGAYSSLEDAVMHHLQPEQFLSQYDCDQLPPELRESCQTDADLQERILSRLDPQLKPKDGLYSTEVKALLSFLQTLTDTSALQLDQLIPEAVPSGLPVADE